MHIWVWSTQGGHTDYVLSIDSIRFFSDCSSLDTTTTTALFEALSRKAAMEGISRSYSADDTNRADGYLRVYHSPGVERSGHGTSTRFLSCTRYPAYTEYRYDHEAIPQMLARTDIYNPGSTSSGRCESAYPTEGIEFALVHPTYSRMNRIH
jgi:hypothetical protein